ncbi:hypothetical protein Tco_0129083, partial [Tanacetum coccineum]
VMDAPDSPTDTPVICHLLSHDHSESEPSERSSSPDSHETVVARWRARVAARPPSSNPSLLPSSTFIPSKESASISIIHALSTKFMATLHVLSTTPVHATSTPVISTTPSQTSLVGPSRMRHRSHITSVTITAHTPVALAPTRADLLPIGKRFRDLVFDYEASVEDGMEADAEADSEADDEIDSEAGIETDVEDEAYTEDYDTYIRTNIVPDAEAHAQIGVEAEIEAEAEKSDGGMCENLLEMPTQRLEEIEEELRVQREREEVSKIKRITLRASVRSLEVVDTWLRGIVKDEREARARIERQLGLVQEEL